MPAPNLTQFSNPLFSNGADPWMQWYEGNYYLVTTTWSSQLVMRKSPTIEGLKTAPPVYVWSDTTEDRCCNFWAFEFHRLNGPNGFRWYLMFTAGHAADLNRQHLVVLESEGDDPMGPYRLVGEPMVNRWNIDGTYLEVGGNLYVLWSEWDGNLQKNWIQRMSNPWTVTGNRAELTAPEYDWERQPGIDNPGLVTEAPEVLQHNGRTFVTYSASSCNGPDYKLGMLELVGNNPLDPNAWYKFPNPVFQRGNGAYGTGHNGFFKSPDGSEDWLVYHANPSANQGCGDSRSVRTQVITWGSDGLPNFGLPASQGQLLSPPSGEAGPLSAQVQGAPLLLLNQETETCLAASNAGNLETNQCSDTNAQWVLDATNDGNYRLANTNSGLFAQSAACSSTNGALVNQGEWRNLDCQKWQVISSESGWLQLRNLSSNQLLSSACNGTGSVVQNGNSNSDCSRWILRPAEQVGIISAQSGKAMDVPNCETNLGTNIQQYEWLSSPCQKWIFEASDGAYSKIKPATNTNACLSYEGSGNLVQGSCSHSNSDFYILPLDDGAVSLRARDDGKAVDLANCDIANAANIQMWDWLDNICQRFSLRRVSQTQTNAVEPPEEPEPGTPVQPSTWNLSGNLGTHDPTIIEQNGVWWQFQTGRGIYGKRSNDGLNWDPLPSVLGQALPWWNTYVPDHANNDVWAPDVHEFNGRTWLYYSISTFGARVSAIGLLSANNIAQGNWRDEGLVIATNNSNNYNAIDPNLIINPQGEPWMVFGSWNTGIMLTRIDPNTMKPTGQLYNIATRGGGIEGPTLIHRNGYYYLFVSVGRCCAGVDSTYQILVGRSQTITGPYLDKNGNNMRSGAGSVVKQTAGNWIGPGGQDIHNGVIAYHSYDANRNGAAILRIETLGWDSSGWPYLP